MFCLGTNESQRSPLEVAAEAIDYIQTVARPKLQQEGIGHEDFIHNMDQTPIPFTFQARRTINAPGSRAVHIRKSTADTETDRHRQTDRITKFAPSNDIKAIKTCQL